MPLGKLKSRQEFLTVANKGVYKATPGLILQAYRYSNNHELPRVGYTVSKRVSKLAVDRNRAKRRLRALAKDVLEKASIPGIDYVLIARRATITCPFNSLKTHLIEALAFVHKRLEE